MQINVTKKLHDFEGNVIKEGEIEYTIGRVLLVALMASPAPGPDGRPITHKNEEHVWRFELGAEISNAMRNNAAGLEDEADASVEISSSQATKLQEDVSRLFGTIIAGQVGPMLNGR